MGFWASMYVLFTHQTVVIQLWQGKIGFAFYHPFNYETVSFNLSARKEEETVYDEVKGQSKKTEETADTNGKL